MKFPQIVKYGQAPNGLKVLVGKSLFGFPILIGTTGKEYIQNSSGPEESSYYWGQIIYNDEFQLEDLSVIQQFKYHYCAVLNSREKESLIDKTYEEIYV